MTSSRRAPFWKGIKVPRRRRGGRGWAEVLERRRRGGRGSRCAGTGAPEGAPSARCFRGSRSRRLPGGRPRRAVVRWTGRGGRRGRAPGGPCARRAARRGRRPRGCLRSPRPASEPERAPALPAAGGCRLRWTARPGFLAVPPPVRRRKVPTAGRTAAPSGATRSRAVFPLVPAQSCRAQGASRRRVCRLRPSRGAQGARFVL